MRRYSSADFFCSISSKSDSALSRTSWEFGRVCCRFSKANWSSRCAVDQFQLRGAQRVFALHHAGRGKGQLVALDAFALAAEAAEVVVEPDRVELTDLAVVEQALDLIEIRLRGIRQDLLLRQRRRFAAGGISAFAPDDGRFQFEQVGAAFRAVAFQRVVGSRGLGLLVGGRAVQVVLL